MFILLRPLAGARRRDCRLHPGEVWDWTANFGQTGWRLGLDLSVPATLTPLVPCDMSRARGKHTFLWRLSSALRRALATDRPILLMRLDLPSRTKGLQLRAWTWMMKAKRPQKHIPPVLPSPINV